jgi:hypothetical protein
VAATDCRYLDYDSNPAIINNNCQFLLEQAENRQKVVSPKKRGDVEILYHSTICECLGACLYVLTRVPGPPIGWPVSVAQPRLLVPVDVVACRRKEEEEEEEEFIRIQRIL